MSVRLSTKELEKEHVNQVLLAPYIYELGIFMSLEILHTRYTG